MTSVVRSTAAACVLAAAAPAAAVATPQVTPPPPDHRSAAPSWRAEIVQDVAARRGPSSRAPVAMRLRTYTAFSRRPQSLMVTGASTDPSGVRWVRVNLPRRPNGAEGWVRAGDVVLRPVSGRVRILVRSRTLEFWRGGRRVLTAPVDVGTGRTPTPVGLFAVQDPVVTAPARRAVYGPHIITLTAWSPVLTRFLGGDGLVAIHGGRTRGGPGRALSHGCVRMGDPAVTRLARLVVPGTPVEVVRA